MRLLLRSVLSVLVLTMGGGCAAAGHQYTGRANGAATRTWAYAVLSIPKRGQNLSAVWRTRTETVVGEILPVDAAAEPSFAAARSLYRKLSGIDSRDTFTGEFDLFDVLGQRGWQLAVLQDDDVYRNYWFRAPAPVTNPIPGR